jgi:hypothetical protein
MAFDPGLAERMRAADAYESHARSTPGAFPIALVGDGREARVFWSKGWRGCPFGCGRDVTRSGVRVFRETRANGYVTKGWYCR